MDEEKWLPVHSAPGVTASSWGRVKLPERVSKTINGGERIYKTSPTYGFVTKSSKTARHSYMNLSNRFLGNLKVHRLVCEAFHGPPPFPKAVVIHMDENSMNNRPDNLKWGTQKENLNMPGFIEYCRSRVGDNSPTVKHRAKKKAEN